MNHDLDHYNNPYDYLRAVITSNSGGNNAIMKHELVSLARSVGLKLDSRASKDEYFTRLAEIMPLPQIIKGHNIGATSADFQKRFGITHDGLMTLVNKGFTRAL